MTGSHEPGGRAEDLVTALRHLRSLVTERDRLPHDSRERSRLQDEIDETQREAWRLAATWDEADPPVGAGAAGPVPRRRPMRGLGP